jgi:hypothetical protein
MSSEAIEREERTVSPETHGSLRPFHGSICPGIGFESGHTIWLIGFDETPTPIGAYSEVWIETPEGELTLYADPGEAAPYISAYHEFDRVEAADLTWREGREGIEVAMDADDGTTLEFRAELARTPRTRLMGILAALTPAAVLRSSVGGVISSLSYDLLLGSGGTKLLGRTETGTRYWGDADRFLAIESATAVLDGTDLGGLAPSPSARDYGDVRTATDPHVIVGRLHLEYPAPGQPSTV